MQLVKSSSISNGWPMQDPVAQALVNDLGGLPGGKAQVLRRPYALWHRQNFPNNGTTELQFYGDAPSQYVGNYFTKGALPANYAFAITGIRLAWLPGIDVNGARNTVDATILNTALMSSQFGTTAVDPTAINAKWHEKNRELIEQGEVTLEVGERTVVHDFGICTFPAGGGYVPIGGVAAGVENTNTTVINSFSHMQMNGANGDPSRCNRFNFGSGYPLMPNQQYKVTVKFKTAVDFTDSVLGPLSGEDAGNPAGVLMSKLEGFLYTPGSS